MDRTFEQVYAGLHVILVRLDQRVRVRKGRHRGRRSSACLLRVRVPEALNTRNTRTNCA